MVHDLETGIAPKRELRGVCGGETVYVWGVSWGLSTAPMGSLLLVNGAPFRVPRARRESAALRPAREKFGELTLRLPKRPAAYARNSPQFIQFVQHS